MTTEYAQSYKQAEYPEPPMPNYFLIMLETLLQNYTAAACRATAMNQFDESSYYRGKADGTRDAIDHYRALK